MRVVVSLLFALAAGCGTYSLGAVIWASLDPEHAGKVLLFSIPLALAATAVPALFGVLALVMSGNGSRRDGKAVPPAPANAPSPAATRRRGLRDDAELSLA
jgi:hypothetical protein